MLWRMRNRDTFDVMTSGLAVVADALAGYAGFMLAAWVRLYSGWFEVAKGVPPASMYWQGAGVATLLLLFIMGALDLYHRPQHGHFPERIPRIVRAVGLSILLALALGNVIRTDIPFARAAIALSFFTVSLLVLMERNILFQLERHWAKYRPGKRSVLVLGTGAIAASLQQTLEREHRLRSRLTGFLSLSENPADVEVPQELIKGTIDDLPGLLQAGGIDQVILANPSALPHERMVDIIIECERNLASFHMVPDMFRLLTSAMEVQALDGIPMLGIGKWPLDHFWNRLMKRSEDIAGAIVGLVLSAPVIAVAGLLVRREAPGPVFYRQERCGEKGRRFTLYKLRTMREDAEAESGPVWTTENDPRRTRVGAFLRRYNLDELPQFWNVLKGDMSLVGPRPERPHFVERFKDDIARYMWRHVSKPGMTGWAQVNGLRGNTSLSERIRHDIYYLENWSLSLDFKVLAKTLCSRENAY
jgi:exopolysaccharide biosynthesis polyprenyl glycosylphosphotransferase